MMIEEDVNGINDGMWRPESRDYLSWRYSSVSMRHDTEREGHPEGAYFNVAGNGNVVFADAHLEPYPRWKLERSKYTDPNHRGN